MSLMGIASADNPNRENGKYLGNNKASIGETIYDCILLEEKLLSGKNKLEPGTNISTVPNNQQIKQKQLDYFLEHWNESLLENETALEEFQKEIASKEMNTGKNVKIDGKTFEGNKTINTWSEEGVGNITINGTIKEVAGNWIYTEVIWYNFIFNLAGTSGQGSGIGGAPATGQDILLYSYEKMSELIKVFTPFEIEDPIDPIIDPGNETNDTDPTNDTNNTEDPIDPIIDPGNETNDTDPTNDTNNTEDPIDPIIDPISNIDEDDPINNYPQANNNENKIIKENNHSISKPQNTFIGTNNQKNFTSITLANMKKNGMPIIIIILVLLANVGLVIRKR